MKKLTIFNNSNHENPEFYCDTHSKYHDHNDNHLFICQIRIEKIVKFRDGVIKETEKSCNAVTGISKYCSTDQFIDRVH